MKKKSTKLFMILLSILMGMNIFSNSAFADTLYTYNNNKYINIQWFGHSCFAIGDKRGTQITTDPFADGIGYKLPLIPTEIVTVSHNHFDHNNLKALENYDHLINDTGIFSHNNVKVKGFSSYHDTEKGEKRGVNNIYTYEINEIKICHLGDLGHELTKEEADKIGQVDILMIPVGGLYTIDSDVALKVIKQLDPKIVLPMHYKTDDLVPEFGELAKVDDFTGKMKDWKAEKSSSLKLTREDLDKSDKKIIILSYK